MSKTGNLEEGKMWPMYQGIDCTSLPSCISMPLSKLRLKRAHTEEWAYLLDNVGTPLMVQVALAPKIWNLKLAQTQRLALGTSDPTAVQVQP